MAFPYSNTYTQTKPTEKLFLNTIPFCFPSDPVTCWFSKEDVKGLHLKRITLLNRPVGLENIFLGLKNNESVYTSFTEEHDGMISLPVNFSDHKNYYFAKRWYNGIINHYFKSKGMPVYTNPITKDNQIWIIDERGVKRSDCWQYDRFTLKIDWDDFNKKPQLLLSYDRPTLVYRKSVADLLEYQGDPFAPEPIEGFNLGMVKKVLYCYSRRDVKNAYKVDNYSYLAEHNSKFHNEDAYPIMWSRLAAFVGTPYEDNNDDDEVYNTGSRKVEKRYLNYYNKINFFYKKFLDNESFRNLIDIDKDGFAFANKAQVGKTKSSTQELVFGGGAIDFNPQLGINNGPLQEPKQTNIQLMFIFHQDDVNPARDLLKFFLREGYKNFFKGLAKYTGKAVTSAPKAFHLQFKDRDNPLPEIELFLRNLCKEEGVSYLAIYLTPHSKHTTDKNAREIYYHVKKMLMDAGIASQCIETEKMLRILEDDNGTDSKGRERKNFAYTLQNMAIAINAKLGGIPWRISTDHCDELIVGVGAFRSSDGTCYVGSAFSFENNGLFNSFNYFLKNELPELAGSIEEAIINFTKFKGMPDRLIIHYYKVMREEEADIIENMLKSLHLNIPVYIVSINKTESEDVVLFDGADNGMMPYSGTYINLGDKKYLLCNNTRYYGKNFNPYDGYPFPVKLHIDSIKAEEEIDSGTLRALIEQVYQFSRIYWKSVKQQNLPVTIKYPEMVAEMAPHFNGEAIPEEFENRLWFL